MKIKKMTPRGLWREFHHLNDRFFSNRIVLKELGFSVRGLPHHASAAYYENHRKILINDDLRGYWRIVSMLLLHEMAHADLHIKGYKGYPGDGGHGGLFQVELDRLYKAGAYDGIL